VFEGIAQRVVGAVVVFPVRVAEVLVVGDAPNGMSILVPWIGRNWLVMPVSSRVNWLSRVNLVSSSMFQVRLGAML
jgi:hypothetical protein